MFEIFHEGDAVATHDINLGGLEMGMFNRALKYEDIERMEILYRNGTPDLVYFPYLDKGTEGLDNQYQSTKISEKTGNLYSKTCCDLFDPKIADVAAVNRPCFTISKIKF